MGILRIGAFHVTGIGQTTIILRHMWLVEHNPEIDWCTGKVSLTRCPVPCGLKTTTDLTAWPIIHWIPPKPSQSRWCTLRRSQKVSQNPERPSHCQDSHVPTRMIWTEGIGSSYGSLVSIRKISRLLRQYPRCSLRWQERLIQHASRTYSLSPTESSGMSLLNSPLMNSQIGRNWTTPLSLMLRHLALKSTPWPQSNRSNWMTSLTRTSKVSTYAH